MGRSGGPTHWARVEEVDGEPEPLESFRFFGVLGTWNEEDIVEACVRNALEQGCERIYLVDNGSEDQTVSRAVAAGAVLARTYATESYSEGLRLQLMGEVVEEVSTESGSQYVWWLLFDADEFPHGRSGLTLRQQIEVLDRRFRIVGARVLNHYPTGAPQYVPGHDPLDYQPLAEELIYPHCDLAHRKHPLQRWDVDGPKITSDWGFHTASAAEQLIEPRVSIVMHHFPFREETSTRARLRNLCETTTKEHAARASLDRAMHDHIWSRYRSMDAVYRQEWGEVTNFLTGERGVTLRPWGELLEPTRLIDELERSITILRRGFRDRELEVSALQTALERERGERIRLENSVTVRALRKLRAALGLVTRVFSRGSQ